MFGKGDGISNEVSNEVSGGIEGTNTKSPAKPESVASKESEKRPFVAESPKTAMKSAKALAASPLTGRQLLFRTPSSPKSPAQICSPSKSVQWVDVPGGTRCYWDWAQMVGVWINSESEVLHCDQICEEDAFIVCVWDFGNYEYMKWCSEVPLAEYLKALPADEGEEGDGDHQRPLRLRPSAAPKSVSKKPSGRVVSLAPMKIKPPKIAMKAAAISGTATAAQINILEAEIPIAIKAEIQKRKDNKDMTISHHNTHSRLYLHFKRIVKTHKMPYDLVKRYANKAVKKVRVTG